MRYIAARSLDAEKVGHGFKNMFDVCQTESLVQFAKSRPRRQSCTHPVVFNIVPRCLLRFSAENKKDKGKKNA